METFQKKLKDIYQSNCSKIKELDKKIKEVKENINKVSLVNFTGDLLKCSSVLIPFFTIIFCYGMDVMVPTVILNCIPCVAYAMGIMISKGKERWKTIFSLKNQKEQIETQANHEIQREKLNSYNQIIKQTLEMINTKKECRITDLSSSDIMIENKKETTMQQVRENVKKQRESLTKLYMELDDKVTKKTLMKMYHESFQKKSPKHLKSIKYFLKNFGSEIGMFLFYICSCTILGGSFVIACISYSIPTLISAYIETNFKVTKERNIKDVYKKIIGEALTFEFSSKDDNIEREQKLDSINTDISIIIKQICPSLMMLQENEKLLGEMLKEIGKEAPRNNTSQYYINNNQTSYSNADINMETPYQNDLTVEKQKTYHI